MSAKVIEMSEVPQSLAVQRREVTSVVLPLRIETQEQYDEVSAYDRVCKEFGDAWSAYWKSPVSKAKDLYDEIRGKRDEVLKPLEEKRVKAKGLLSDFLTRKAAEERRLQAEAAARAQKEAEALRKQEIKELKNMGAPKEFVQEFKAQPLDVRPAEVAPTFQRASGQTAFEKWEATCTDKKLLIGFIHANPEYGYLLDVNQSRLNECADIKREKFNLPGCEAKSRFVVRAGR